MSKYFDKTHEKITLEETICGECGGTWFWSLQQVTVYKVYNDKEVAIISCPYCGAKHAYVI